MKLNPPASSSDLEAAREIARRLHQSRRREDRSATTWSSEEAPARTGITAGFGNDWLRTGALKGFAERHRLFEVHWQYQKGEP